MKTYIVRILYITALLEFCLVGYLWLNQSNTIKNTIVLATSAKPEPFTELYFEKHDKLPHEVTPSKPSAFTFTIHNLEQKNMQYRYIVYADLGGEKITVDEGTIPLAHNTSKSVTERFKTDNLEGRMKMVVELPEKQQDISFWIEGKENNEKQQ